METTVGLIAALLVILALFVLAKLFGGAKTKEKSDSDLVQVNPSTETTIEEKEVE